MTIKLSECLDDADKLWEWLQQEDAWDDGSEWAKGPTLRQTWAELKEPNVMMWLIQTSGTDLMRECAELAINRRVGVDARGNLTGNCEAMKAAERFATESAQNGSRSRFAIAVTTEGSVPMVASADEIRGKITVEMLVGGAQ